MSSSQVVDWVGNGKIFNDLLPNPYPYPAFPSPLAAVLAVDNNAGNQNIENLFQLETSNVVQQTAIGGSLTIGGTPLNPGSGGTLRIQGATDKGSLLVGDGTDTKELVCPTTNSANLQTDTIYNWNSLSNGQSKTYAVPDGSVFQPGYSITITYSGTDFVTGTITAVVGNDITLTITNKGNAVYINGPLIATTPPDPSAIAGSLTNPVFTLNPATTTPTPPQLQQFSMITGGLCFLYSTNGNPSPTPFTISILGTNIDRPTSASANTPLYENPPVTPTAYAYADGCFVRDTQIVQIQANTSGVPIDFGFPTGGSFAPADYCGTISGYTLAYGGGTITINSKLVLTADPLKPLGVFWGVDAQGVGSVTSVSAGTNITISGSLSAPVVNLATPTTSNIQLGVGTELLATSGFTTMSIDSTGLNDTYLNGLVENKEDIAVSATNVIQTLSATDGSTYQNTAIVNCGTSSISDQKLAVNLTTTQEGSAGMTCGSTLASMGVGCGFPSGAAGSVGLQATDTNPTISLSQSAPFATSYSTILDRDGITQNNSGGNGFRCRSAQDIFLEPTNGQPNPQLGVIRIPNGNSINMSVDTYTTSYRKDGMGVSDVSIPSSSAAACDLTATGGNSQLFLGSSNIGTSQHTLRAEVPLVGDATIEHEIVSGASRNLVISSQGNITTTATGNATLQGSGSNIVCSATSINGTSQVFQNFSSQSGTSATPNFIFREVAPTAAGACVIKMDKAVAPAVGNAISAIASYALDGTGTSREWSRIQTKVENVGAGNQDATLSIFNSVNGVVSETFNFNGGQNENNSFRPLDMNGNDIRSSTGNTFTITTQGSSGNGDLFVSSKRDVFLQASADPAGRAFVSANANVAVTSLSGAVGINANTFAGLTATTGAITTTSGGNTTLSTTGVGSFIELKPESTAGQVVFTGAALQSATAGGNSGQHLVITLNGSVYKIKLELP